MKTTPKLALRLVIAALAAFGLFGVVPVSFAELSTGGACPHLGSVPACHIVAIAYGLVLITVLHPKFWNPTLFLLAWAPIFLLAAAGSGLELMGQGTCPKTATGIPKCYFSLALAVALIAPAIVHFMTSKQAAE